MKERPISFSASMVRAILEGRKTQTRRVIVPQPPHHTWNRINVNGKYNVLTSGSQWVKCPYGMPGDRLWIREVHCLKFDIDGNTGQNVGICAYAADLDTPHKYHYDSFSAEYDGIAGCTGNRPARFMFKWASRIMLELTNVRVQQVQDITYEDIKAEGCSIISPSIDLLTGAGVWYHNLWNSINAKRGYTWESNPWIWALTFQCI